MDIVLKIAHATLDSSWMKTTQKHAKNAQITVSFATTFSNANSVLLDIKPKFSKSVDKTSPLALKFVEMELNMKPNAMMETRFPVMAAQVHATLSLDGHVPMDRQSKRANATNIFLTQLSLLLWVLSTSETELFKVLEPLISQLA